MIKGQKSRSLTGHNN